MDVDGRSWPVTTRDGVAACYDGTFDVVFRYASGLTADRSRAEDLVSEAYMALVKASRSGSVPSIDVGWLITVVQRRFVDGLRSAERESRGLRLVEPPPDVVPASTDHVHEVLASLTDRERAAIVLHHVDGLPIARVADLLGSSVRATESLLARARRKARAGEVRDA